MKVTALLAAMLFTANFASAATIPCPTERGVYVLQGDAWEPMQGVYASKIIPGHMKAGGGAGIIAIFASGESPDRIKSSKPSFCAVGAQSDSAIHFLTLQARGKERRLIVAKSANWKGVYAKHQRWFAPESEVPFIVTKEHDRAWMFTPQLSLQNGEYIIFTDMADSIPGGRSIDPHLVKGYDFGYFAR